MSSLSRITVWAAAALTSMSVCAGNLPVNITFDNNTDLTINAYTAGQPGASIAAKSSSNIPYVGVLARCNIGGKPKACPIEFFDNASGQKIGQVLLNVMTGQVVDTPRLESNYQHLNIQGWQSTPINHITIQ